MILIVLVEIILFYFISIFCSFSFQIITMALCRGIWTANTIRIGWKTNNCKRISTLGRFQSYSIWKEDAVILFNSNIRFVMKVTMKIRGWNSTGLLLNTKKTQYNFYCLIPLGVGNDKLILFTQHRHRSSFLPIAILSLLAERVYIRSFIFIWNRSTRKLCCTCCVFVTAMHLRHA